jgi:hypothetical protein
VIAWMVEAVPDQVLPATLAERKLSLSCVLAVHRRRASQTALPMMLDSGLFHTKVQPNVWEDGGVYTSSGSTAVDGILHSILLYWTKTETMTAFAEKVGI